ncbi:MAG: transglutaminase-like domain-containing protein [Eubacteriales bacterium]|nr:transglutaminase-like domain-containing protein [Eubacteriales bacterium]
MDAYIKEQFLDPVLVNKEDEEPALASILYEQILRNSSVRNSQLGRVLPNLEADAWPGISASLFDKIDNLPAPLELNCLLARKVSYRPGLEAYPARPVAVLTRGFGRCGELSTLLVRLLRLAMIPARQVYVPLWAHTDDNHAWVEYYHEGKWHFVGAAEPELKHDRGWFIPAASRAPWVACRVTAEPEGMSLPRLADGGYLMCSNELYFQPKSVKIKLVNCAEAASIKLSVLLYNEGYLRNLASFRLDEAASLNLSLNYLDLKIAFKYRGSYYEFDLPADLEGEFIIDMAKAQPIFHASHLNKIEEVKLIADSEFTQGAPNCTKSFPPQSETEHRLVRELRETCAKFHRQHLKFYDDIQSQLLAELAGQGIELSREAVENLSLLGAVGRKLLKDFLADEVSEAYLKRSLTVDFRHTLFGSAMQKSTPRNESRTAVEAQLTMQKLENCDWKLCEQSEEAGLYRVVKTMRQRSGNLEVREIVALLPEGEYTAAELLQSLDIDFANWQPAIEARQARAASSLSIRELGRNTGLLVYLGGEEPSIRLQRGLKKFRKENSEMPVVYKKLSELPEEMIRENFILSGHDCYTFLIKDGQTILAEAGAEWPIDETLKKLSK